MIAKDKIKHLIAGAIISAVTYWLVMLIFKSSNDALYISILVSALSGYAKERYDVVKEKPTGFDKIDLLATVIGGVITSILIYFI